MPIDPRQREEARPTADGQALSISVLICTFRRPASLDRCLDALARQKRRPDEVIVVYRQTDEATCGMLDERGAAGFPLSRIAVASTQLVTARNVGLRACRTDVLAMIDDDVVPHSAWLERLGRHFEADPSLGALGGRDHVHDGRQFDERLAPHVGRVQWFGRVISNHHLGCGPARPVQLLKGANMAFRARAVATLEFDRRLRGKAIQPHEDLALSLAVGRCGWKVVYDPAVLVYHYAGRPERRAYSSVRVSAPDELRDTAFNIVVALWDELSPLRRVAFAAWSLLIGSRTDPGLFQALRYTRQQGTGAWQRFALTQQGKAAAFAALIRGNCPAFCPAEAPPHNLSAARVTPCRA